MKRILLLTTVITTTSFGLERKEVMPLIEEASIQRESAYVDVRNRIIAFGTNAIPILGDVAIDESVPWQQRLVARICYERIGRGQEIKKLLDMDWYSHPKIDPTWPYPIMGQEGFIAKLVEADVKEIGLWYYCLELEWKMTGEKGNLREWAGNSYWTSACTAAVRDNPEERIWFLRICADLMAISPTPTRWTKWLYPTLKKEEKLDSTYVLEHRAPPSALEPPFRLGSNIVKRAKQE